LCRWIDHQADKLTVDSTQRLLRQTILRAIQAGTLSTLKVTSAAERYHEIDVALRQLFAEGLDIPGIDVAATTALRSYLQRALVRDITKREQGAQQANFMRECLVVVLMGLTLVCWPHLRKGRAAELVATALRARAVADIGHKQVLKIFADPDQIVRKLAQLIPDDAIAPA
jgi:hypothetical protein